MGRHKQIHFPCISCDKTFKRRANLKKHMSCHSNFAGQSRCARMRSKWCHVCRQSFTESKYKLHVKTEHQYDSYEKDSDNENENMLENKDLTVCSKDNAKDFYTSESEYILPKNIKREIDKMSTAKSPKKKAVQTSKVFQVDPAHSVIKIKTEPPDVPSDIYMSNVSLQKRISNVSLQKRRKLNTRAQFIICSKCGMKCKGERGLKIHLSTTHRRNSVNKYKHKNSSEVLKTGTTLQLKQELPNGASEQCNNSLKSSINNQTLFAYNAPSNLNQNTQTGLIYNMFPIQNQPLNDLISSGNQPNSQMSSILSNQNQPVETIPKFDHGSENYIKWLKKFIYRCKMHKYPLTPMLCQSVSHINEEITDSLANPVGSMKKRSNHFYFMKIKSLLSEIMLGQLRYSLNVVKR